MKLYFSTGSCSLSPQIVASELGLNIEAIRVDLKAHKTASGKDYYEINPKGAVPALALDDGTLITEGAVICQYLCDNHGGEKLLPKVGSPDRYKVLMWMNYVATEIHKGYSPLFGLNRFITNEAGAKEFGESWRKYLIAKYKVIEKALSESTYLTGEKFSPADAYLFTVTNWAKPLNLDLTAYPKLMGFMEKVNARPAVQAAITAQK